MNQKAATPGPRLVTLFTDAGWCPRTQVASYAVWAKADGQTLRRSGILKTKADGSDVAELRALVNGVALVIGVMKPGPGALIIAQTDCQAAIDALLGKAYRNKKGARRMGPARNMLRGMVRAAGVGIEYRHVKGHKGNATPRNAVNSWCDDECRRWLRADTRASDAA